MHFLILLISLYFLTINACFSQQVFLEAEGAGQGILKFYNDECYLFAPSHVLGDAWEAEIITVGGQRKQSEISKKYPPDIGIGKISGPVQNCNPLKSSALDLVLGGTTEAKLRYVSSAGTIRTYQVRILRVNEDFFEISPINRDFEIHQGMSGAAILLNDAIVGQLQSVDGSTGVGKVIRLDYLLAASQRFFDAKNPYVQKVPGSLPRLLSHTIDSGMIVRGNPDAVISGPVEQSVSFWWQPQPVMLEVAVFGQSYELNYLQNIYAANSDKPIAIILSGVIGSNDNWRVLQETKISNSSIQHQKIGEVAPGFSRIRVEFRFPRSVREAALGLISFK